MNTCTYSPEGDTDYVQLPYKRTMYSNCQLTVYMEVHLTHSTKMSLKGVDQILIWNGGGGRSRKGTQIMLYEILTVGVHKRVHIL